MLDLPCVPEQKQRNRTDIFFALYKPLELIIHQKFKARAHLPARFCVSRHAFVFHFVMAMIPGTHSNSVVLCLLWITVKM
jgi:hypothetical protein